ncbi:leukotoxin LktA family filamentous adhesin, partial [bacterium]|nr:leukotoxin LktA family filamentous adhesin [bacterium]
MRISKRPKRIVAAAITAMFLSHQTLMMSVVASEITGVTGNNGVYNIDPSALINGTDIGYRKYKDFTLDQGDIANLIYKYGDTDINTFVNLVDNQVNINGLVNTMRNGSFHNGKAIFISPNGMIVGASGVLNVGSLGVYTPTHTKYEEYKANPTANLNSITQVDNNNAAKVITINGKVIAANDVDLRGGMVTVGNTGSVIAGVNESKMAALTSHNQAETLFNQLVNTDNLNSANSFASDNGNIYIKSGQIAENTGINIEGNLKNFGTGNTQLINTGAEGINVSGTIANADGIVKLNSNWGGIDVSGDILNNGTTQIFNLGREGKVSFNADGQTYTYTVTPENGVNISGNVNTTGTTTITNTGTEGIIISGTVANTGDLSIQNGVAGNTENGNARNAQMDALTITGNVNSQGNADIVNYAAGGLNIDGEVTNNNANVDLTGETTITNHAGILKVDGLVDTNEAELTMTNNGENFEINGTIIGTNNNINLINNNGGIDLNSTGKVNSTNDVNITNIGTGGVNVKGLVNAGQNVNIDNKNSNVVIGDNTENDNYVTAGN